MVLIEGGDGVFGFVGRYFILIPETFPELVWGYCRHEDKDPNETWFLMEFHGGVNHGVREGLFIMSW